MAFCGRSDHEANCLQLNLGVSHSHVGDLWHFNHRLTGRNIDRHGCAWIQNCALGRLSTNNLALLYQCRVFDHSCGNEVEVTELLHGILFRHILQGRNSHGGGGEDVGGLEGRDPQSHTGDSTKHQRNDCHNSHYTLGFWTILLRLNQRGCGLGVVPKKE